MIEAVYKEDLLVHRSVSNDKNVQSKKQLTVNMDSVPLMLKYFVAKFNGQITYISVIAQITFIAETTFSSVFPRNVT